MEPWMVVLVAIAGRMEVGTLGADGVILVVETEVVVVDCSSDRVGQDSVWILTQAHAAADGGPAAESDTSLRVDRGCTCTSPPRNIYRTA